MNVDSYCIESLFYADYVSQGYCEKLWTKHTEILKRLRLVSYLLF